MCSGTKNEEFVERKGLVKGHAYSLISSKEKYYNSNIIQLITLFNPWAKIQKWNGMVIGQITQIYRMMN